MSAIVISDLDGTLLNNDERISGKDYSTLLRLQKRGITTVLATGRNLYSCTKLLPADFPVQYLIFSNGCGIMHWPTKEIIVQNLLPSELNTPIYKTLIEHKLDFFTFELIPENHLYRFKQFNLQNLDFNKRKNRTFNFSLGEMNESYLDFTFSQFLVILEDMKYIPTFNDTVMSKCSMVHSTSPVDGKSLWLEILPLNVSKGEALKKLCEVTEISLSNTYAMGNDYNDVTMLETAAYSYLVKNATIGLAGKFPEIVSNNEHPLSALVKMHKLV